MVALALVERIVDDSVVSSHVEVPVGHKGRTTSARNDGNDSDDNADDSCGTDHSSSHNDSARTLPRLDDALVFFLLASSDAAIVFGRVEALKRLIAAAVEGNAHGFDAEKVGSFASKIRSLAAIDGIASIHLAGVLIIAKEIHRLMLAASGRVAGIDGAVDAIVTGVGSQLACTSNGIAHANSTHVTCGTAGGVRLINTLTSGRVARIGSALIRVVADLLYPLAALDGVASSCLAHISRCAGDRGRGGYRLARERTNGAIAEAVNAEVRSSAGEGAINTARLSGRDHLPATSGMANVDHALNSSGTVGVEHRMR